MAIFTCTISRSKLFKRLVFTTFLLLFCSVIRIIPIDIQTKIVNQRVSNYIDLRQEKVNVIQSNIAQYDIDKESNKDELDLQINDNKDYDDLNDVNKNNMLIKDDKVGNKLLDNVEKDSETHYELNPKDIEQQEKAELPIPSANTSQEISSYRRYTKSCRRIRFELGPNQRSILASFGKGRLGNKLSSFASCYAIAKDFGLYNYISENQHVMLRRVFDFPTLKDDREDASYYVWKKGKN